MIRDVYKPCLEIWEMLEHVGPSLVADYFSCDICKRHHIVRNEPLGFWPTGYGENGDWGMELLLEDFVREREINM